LGSNNQFATPADGQVLIPEMVQQMIVSAFSALGIQGNDITSYFCLLILVRPII